MHKVNSRRPLAFIQTKHAVCGCHDIMEAATPIVLCPAQTSHSERNKIFKQPRGSFSATAAVSFGQTTGNYG